MSLPDEYLNTDDEPSAFLPTLGEVARSPGQPFGFDQKGMMASQELVRAHSFWHIPLFAREQGYFADAKQITVEHGAAKLTTELTRRDQNRVQFPVAQALNVDVPLALGTGFCDQFVYVMGADEVGAGVLGGSSPANPYDGFVCVRVKMEWRFDNTTDFDDMNLMMQRADAIVTSRFNVRQHLVARGTFQGKAVRLRYLFCPRYVLHTFPTSGSFRDPYLDKLAPALAKKDKPTYEAAATANVAANGVHAIIRVTSGGGTPGVTPASSSPRRALIREDGFLSSRFDRDFALVFAQLLGLNDASFSSPNDFKALADQLPAAVSGVRLSFE